MPVRVQTLVFIAAAWSLLCATGGFLWWRRYRDAFRAERGLLLGALALAAVAPWTWTLLHLVDDDPELYGSVVQLVMAALLLTAAAFSRRRRLRDIAAKFTYTEKSAALALAALLWIYGSFFIETRGLPLDVAMGAFFSAAVQLVVVMIIGHTLIALFHSPTADLDSPRDERDRAVELLSMRNAYWVLAGAIWSVPVMLIRALPLHTMLQVWLAIVVLAEVVYYGSLLAYYRLGTA